MLAQRVGLGELEEESFGVCTSRIGVHAAMVSMTGSSLATSDVGREANRRHLDVVAVCSYVAHLRFEWDEAKRLENLVKHGVDFVDVPPLFDGLTATVIDDRFDYGEDRFITVGVVHGIVLTVAHTETDERIRLISARKATSNEEEGYFRQIRD